MIKLNECIIVEGKYDKIKLESIFDTLIIATNGFDIFSDKNRMEMIASVAQKRGAVILTDSDWAGFEIRHKLISCLTHAQVYNAYVPDIYGKEKRKEQPSKEGKLGVEGIDPQIIIKAVMDSGVKQIDQTDHEAAKPQKRAITKTDLFLDGLSGGENSRQKMDAFKEKCSLPQHLSKNALLGVLNSLMSYEQYRDIIDSL